MVTSLTLTILREAFYYEVQCVDGHGLIFSGVAFAPQSYAKGSADKKAKQEAYELSDKNWETYENAANGKRAQRQVLKAEKERAAKLALEAKEFKESKQEVSVSPLSTAQVKPSYVAVLKKGIRKEKARERKNSRDVKTVTFAPHLSSLSSPSYSLSLSSHHHLLHLLSHPLHPDHLPLLLLLLLRHLLKHQPLSDLSWLNQLISERRDVFAADEVEKRIPR